MVNQQATSVIQSTYPSLNEDWVVRLLEMGQFKELKRDETISQHNNGMIQSVFIIEGLLLGENKEGMQLLKHGNVYGLRETLLSVDLSNQNGVYTDDMYLDGKLTCISQSAQCLIIDGNLILREMENNPELREGWLYVLNSSFEKQLNDGLYNYQLDTLDRLRRVLKQLKHFADEHFAVSIHHIQELTGISRSSIYRCLRTLEKEEQLVFCSKGHICFCRH